MDAYFGPAGRLSAALAGFEPRPEQEALADAVADSLASREHLVAEAGTGTGKSLAYLLPALVSGRRVVVATATKALQEQLLTKDVPAAAAALGRPVAVAVLKGRQNYLCRKSLQGVDQLGGLFRTAEDASDFERLRDWIETTETGDRAELEFEPSQTLWAELSVGAERCGGRRCPLVGSCYAERARERAGEAEIVIANHALYFADLALRARSDGAAVLPDHDAVVFDEAHRLEEAAAAWFGGRISLARLRQLERDVERFCREQSRTPPARNLAEVDRAGERLIGAFDPGSGRRRLTAADQTKLEEHGLTLADALGGLASALMGTGEEGDMLARRALAAADDVESCMALDDLDRVSWAEPGTVAWAPVDVSGLLRESLWDSDTTAVLVSATLDPRFVRRRLGLDDAHELILPSPFDYRDQALVYVPARLPEPRSPGYFDSLADEIVSLCRLSAGRALVLTSSYRALDELVERCAGRLQFPVLKQGDAPRERLLERFRDDVGSILFATSTFWQGVDIQGESLSLLVIDKLPFAAPGDPIVEARCERIAREGGDWFSDYALPAAVLQLRQGFGRLIRGHADEGVVAILDPRLRTRAYGRRFLEALPPAPVVAELPAVADFFGAQERATA
ncbi:MAG TPA: ATP-dependent DNA helicase [Gaiellaceae bacterium]|nr:ATP-dependent DNA helicase [Gaiellaceae bacterium]